MYNVEVIEKTKGFLDPEEGAMLYEIALKASKELNLPGLEIGSYCGKSTLYLGAGCREADNIMFSIDHHRGSEEQQPGEEYFDKDLYDEKAQKIDTFPFFRHALNEADLESHVVPVVGSSHKIGKFWTSPLSFLFIDGGHTLETEFGDYLVWSPKLKENGYLMVHDIFDSPELGGQAPRLVFEKALKSGKYELVKRVKTLGVLKRISDGKISASIRDEFLNM